LRCGDGFNPAEAISDDQAVAKAKPDLPDVYYRLGGALRSALGIEEAVAADREPGGRVGPRAWSGGAFV
jgi:hypothetical protein